MLKPGANQREDLVSGKEISQLSDDLSDHLAGETLAVGGGSHGW